MATKEFTLGEFIDAIEKDGLPQAYGGLFWGEGDFITVDDEKSMERIKNRPIEKACALGQGFINIGVWPFIEDDYLEDVIPQDVLGYVVSLNDSQHTPIRSIAELMRYQFGHRLDEKYVGTEVEYNVVKG